MKNRPKLLVIGENSLVGSTFLNFFGDNFHTYSTFYHKQIFPNSTKIDLISQSNSLLELLEKFRPDFVIHTVAYPNVDFCETHPQDAKFLHVKLTEQIAKVCESINSKIFYFSTDAVFDGTSETAYSEVDEPNPLSYYGKTKLEAEKILIKASNKNVVLRTTVIYGSDEKSRFTNWVLKKLYNNEPVPAFTDQFNTPTLVDDLCKSIMHIIEKDVSGIFHASGKTCLSRYDFAKKLAKIFSMDENLIIPTLSSNTKQIAPRPEKGCLNSQHLEKIINFKFSTIDEGLHFIFKNQAN